MELRRSSGRAMLLYIESNTEAPRPAEEVTSAAVAYFDEDMIDEPSEDDDEV